MENKLISKLNIVQEIETDSKSSDESEGESQRTARKVETENPEARFFLKDKLCAIGLADVSIVER